jgi:four helix bundle protein
MKLEDLEIYRIAMSVGEKVWLIVEDWSYFAKDTVGKQLVKASDSIAANISEGFGRYHYKEARQFAYYARDSLYETKTWLTKASNRNLLNKQEFESIINNIDILAVKLNNFINSIGRKK